VKIYGIVYTINQKCVQFHLFLLSILLISRSVKLNSSDSNLQNPATIQAKIKTETLLKYIHYSFLF